jgi:DNA-binding XRE family transcriptional regulator
MNKDFERIHQIDPQREEKIAIEKHLSIELTDEMNRNGFIFREPDKSNPKLELAQKICENIKIIDLSGANEKIPSKSSKRKSKRINSESNKTTMA